MKRLIFAIGVLALGFAASTPARADFAVVKWHSGFCRVWADTSVVPIDGRFLWWRAGWHHWYYRLPTWEIANAKWHQAIAHHRCRW